MDIRASNGRLPEVADMQRAVAARDQSYDGVFFLAVTTTGVFCRPSCPARKPLAKNSMYYATAREAVFAGFRPCKRCHPMEAGGAHPDWLRELLAAVDSDPETRISDMDLRRRGLDPGRVRRAFLERFGLTFHAYARGRRLGRSLEAIRLGQPLDDVILGHGYDSYSGFRDAFGRVFGTPPGHSRTTDCVRLSWLESPLGPLVVGATAAGVCLVEFSERRMLESQLQSLGRKLAMAVVPGENEHLDQLRVELESYFAGQRQSFEVPVILAGTPFQERVWRTLSSIPYGAVWSYEDVAAAAGAPSAFRAVGRANGANRIAIVIPCHRVVQKDGQIGGYGGGVWRKQRLLALEQGTAPLT